MQGKIEIFSPEAREEIEQLCRTPLQVQRICWEAIKQGYQEGEKQISRDTILCKHSARVSDSLRPR
jgi:type II secretory pathway predicted ATPase ExeA